MLSWFTYKKPMHTKSQTVEEPFVKINTENKNFPLHLQTHKTPEKTHEIIKEIKYKRLIHPTQKETDDLEDGDYDIVFTSGGWYVGNIKNGSYNEGTYIYPNKNIATGIFDNRLNLKKGIIKLGSKILEGTFIIQNNKLSLHGDDCKITYTSGIIYEGTCVDIFYDKIPIKGKFTIPEDLNLTFTSSDTCHGWWEKKCKDGPIECIKGIRFDKTTLKFLDNRIIKYRDGCILDEFEKTFTYPKNFKGLKYWGTEQLENWFRFKFQSIKYKWIKEKNLDGSIFVKMADNHFTECGISDLSILLIRDEMNKIM